MTDPGNKYGLEFLVSLVIPAFNEETLLARTLRDLTGYLKQRFSNYEIIVVDDGSTDDTSRVVTSFSRSQPAAAPLILLRNDRNRGKGFSVQRGMLASRGRYVFFIDADLPYDPEAIPRMIETLQAGYSLAIGLRVLKGAEKRTIPPLRYLAGQTFSLLVRMLAVPGIRDTQCGIKGFKAEAAHQIFNRLSIHNFGFDVEMLYIARKLGYSIQPVSVKMTGHRYDSRVRVFRDSLQMLLDLFIIRLNDLRGCYK